MGAVEEEDEDDQGDLPAQEDLQARLERPAQGTPPAESDMVSRTQVRKLYFPNEQATELHDPGGEAIGLYPGAARSSGLHRLKRARTVPLILRF